MKRLYGIIYVVLSSAAFGIMPVLAKLAYNTGMDALSVVFFRFFFAAIILFLFVIYKKVNLHINKRQAILIVLLALVGYASTSITLFLSYDYISVGLATTIHFLYPIIVTIASFFIYKEKIDFKKSLALIISAFGMYLLVSGGNINLDTRGILFAFASAIFYSIYILGVSEPEIKKINTYVSIFYVCSISSIAILILIFFKNGGNMVLHVTKQGIISVFFISFISTGIALAMFVKGIQIVGPSAASILSTLEPIVSIILGTLILKEILTFNIVIGCILIVASVIILTISNSKKTS